MIRVSEVVKHREIDGKDSHCRDADGNCRRDPVNAAKACPSEHEETDGEKNTLVTCEVQPCFWRFGKLVVLDRNFLLVYANDCKDDGGDAD